MLEPSSTNSGTTKLSKLTYASFGGLRLAMGQQSKSESAVPRQMKNMLQKLRFAVPNESVFRSSSD